MSYLWHSLGGILPPAVMQSVYSTTPAERASYIGIIYVSLEISLESYQQVKLQKKKRQNSTKNK